MSRQVTLTRRCLGCFWAAGCIALACAFLASPASAAVPNFKGSSADGDAVFFETADQLVPGDTDTRRDVYVRSFDVGVGEYVTREVSLGPTGGNDAYHSQFEGVSDDGSKVFFTTEERLVGEDTDRRTDVYSREPGGETVLVSQGAAACAPACGNGAVAASFVAASADGGLVVLRTEERLANGDTDGAVDLYLRDIAVGETVLVSVGAADCGGACGNGDFDVSPRSLSANASHVFFTTQEPLAAADGDSASDIYARNLDAETTALVSQGGCLGCGDTGVEPIFNGSSDAGDRVFFSTDEKLVGNDDDAATDVYARDLPGGPTILISGGTATTTASFAAASADGAHVFFTSAESLVGDGDGANDVYEWSGGNLELVTTAACTGTCGATFDAVSADSSHVLYTTAERQLPADTDSRDDIYRQEVGGGAPTLASRGEGDCPACWNGAVDARFNEASDDASRVIFTTLDGLLAEDTDGEDDIYLRDLVAGTSNLITTSPSYCPLTKGNCGATYVGASDDGLHVFFRTVERFTLDDGDNEADIYERFLDGDQAVTRLVSTGNSPNLDLGPPTPVLTGTDPESPAASLSPRVLGDAEPGATVKIYSSPDCTGEPVVSGSAGGLADPGLAVTVLSGSLTSFRATAEAEGFVSACSGPISYLQLSGGGEPGGPEGPKDEEGGVGEGFVEIEPAPLPRPNPAAGMGAAKPLAVPLTRITFAPAAKTRSRNPVLRFTDATGQDGTSFLCKLDRKPWQACASPLRLKRLKKGRHTVLVRGVNAEGLEELGMAKRVFKVVPR